MIIKKSFILSLTITLIIFPLYFCNQNKVFSENSNNTSNNFIKKSKETSKNNDLWSDLWCVKSDNDITIIKNGHPVSKNSKEYSKLLKICKDRIKKDEEYASSFNQE